MTYEARVWNDGGKWSWELRTVEGEGELAVYETVATGIRGWTSKRYALLAAMTEADERRGADVAEWVAV